MAIEKQIKTKISLRYLEYATWSTESFKAEKPLKGEVWFCAIPEGNANATTAPTMLFKVGDGVNTFGNLKWGSALAADVYAWAKCSNVELDGEVLKFHNGDKEHPVHTVDLSKFALDADLGDVSTLTTTAKTAVSAINEHDAEIGNLANLATENKDDLVTAINEVRQAVEVGGTGSVVTVRKDNENKYTVRQGNNDVEVSIEIADGTLTVKGENGLTGSGTFGANQTEDDTITLSHADTSSVANVTATDRTYVKSLTFDDYGHVTAVDVGTETVVNTAHTHAVGDGLLLGTVKGGIEGEVLTSLNLAFTEDKTNKLLKLVDAGDNSKVIASFDTTNFIADGMLQKVEVDAAANKIIFTWNTNNAEGKTVTEIELDKIADIYTPKANAAEVQVAISNSNEISATLTKTVTDDIAKGVEAQGWGNHANAGYAANADLTKVINGTTPVAKATDADTLDGHDSTYFATDESVTNITKVGGTIDSKITAYDASKGFGDIITHNVAEFATNAQGGKADTALQEIEAGTGLKVTEKAENKQTIEIDTDVVFVLDCNW